MTYNRWMLAAAGAVMLGGCGGADGGGGIDGTYCTAGDMKIVLKAGVVTSEGRDGSYTLDGEKVIITNPSGGTTTFMRQPDGSLSTGATTLKKCAG